jgi:ATP-binding cassette subfamily C protein
MNTKSKVRKRDAVTREQTRQEKCGYFEFINSNSREIRKYQVLILFISAITGILIIKLTLSLSSFLTALFERASIGTFVAKLLPLIAVFSAFAITSIIASYLSQIITYKTRSELMEKAYYSISSSSVSRVKEFTIGDIITRVTNDIIQISDVVATFVPNTTSNAILFGFYFVSFYSISHLLSYVFLMVAPLYYLIFVIERKRLPPLIKKEREALSDVTLTVNEFTSNIEGIKGLSAEIPSRKEYGRYTSKFYGTSKKMINSLIKYTGASSYLRATIPFFLLAIAFYFYTVNLVAIGPVITFFFLSSQAYSPLSSISGYLSSYATGIARYQRVGEVMNMEPERSGGSTMNTLVDCEFAGVSVEKAERRILEIDELIILRGEHIAITGENGSGKSTFTKLFDRLVEYEGRVEMNKNRIEEYSLASLRKNVVRIGETPFIFKDSVKNNITLYDTIPGEEVQGAMTFCGIDFVKMDDLIEYDTLSEGQRQRISLARAIVRKPDFLIMDEALSGIDDRSEDLIVGNIMNELPHSTILLVSHRYSTLMRMERFIIFKNGRISCDINDRRKIAECSEWNSLMKFQITK